MEEKHIDGNWYSCEKLPKPWQKVWVRDKQYNEYHCEFYQDKGKISKSGGGRFLSLEGLDDIEIQDILYWIDDKYYIIDEDKKNRF